MGKKLLSISKLIHGIRLRGAFEVHITETRHI